jgi:5-formyltetrahydrofolate cyclo-ligase
MSALPDRALTLEKRKLREQLLARRQQIPHAAMLAASQSAARHFADHPILAFAPSFAGYIAIRGELDILPVFDLMQRYGKLTALPCVTAQKTLIFRRWQRGDRLVRHPALQIEEPPPDAPSVIPEIVLVPLLAFDAEGYRLGYGAGYYDRTMEALRQFERPPLFIGVAYGKQEVEQVPADAHDQKLDGILTELGVSMFRSVL